MASITTAGSGNWNSTTPNAPWPSGTIPASTDTVIIANGHTVTVPVGYTAVCGDPTAPSTHAIDCNGSTGTGILIVNGTLQIAANVRCANATWTINAGAIVESTNTGTLLTWQTAAADNQANAKLVVAGTGPGSGRVTIRKGAGSAGLRFTNGNFTRSQHDWDWFIAEGLGDASNVAVQFHAFNGSTSTTFDDGWFDGCGKVQSQTYNCESAATVRLRRVTFMNTVSTECYSILSVSSPSVPRLIEDCVFDKQCATTGYLSFEHRRVVYGDAVSQSGAAHTWEDIIANTKSGSSGASIPFKGSTWTRGFITATNSALTNWHGVIVTGSSMTSTVTFDGPVIDAAITTDDGDLILPTSPSSAVTLNVQNVLMTAASNSTKSYGVLTSVGGNANVTFGDLVHNTAWTDEGEPIMFRFGETSAGRTAMVSGAVKSNLALCTTSGRGALIGRVTAGATANIRDYADPANVTHNLVQNANPGGAGVGTGFYTFAGGDGVLWNTVPTAPLDVDPALFDITRNLATYYRSVVGGTSGTRSADMLLLFDALASLNTDSPVAGFTQATAIEDARTWVRTGYAPTNVAAQAAHDGVNGGWIGAVEGIATSIPVIQHNNSQKVRR